MRASYAAPRLPDRGMVAARATPSGRPRIHSAVQPLRPWGNRLAAMQLARWLRGAA